MLKQSRSTQRYKPKLPDKDKPVIDDLLVLHVKHPRYGYRRITIKLREKGWFINFKRVYRLWCQEGLKIRRKQHKRLYAGCSENACNRKKPERYNHIWSYDFLSERLENGRLVKLLVVIDEFTRESLAIDVNQKIKGPDVVEALLKDHLDLSCDEVLEPRPHTHGTDGFYAARLRLSGQETQGEP